MSEPPYDPATEAETLRVGPGDPAEPTRIAPARPAPGRPRVPPQLGAYRLEEEIGHGGMGVVYRATHLKLGTPCAVKVLLAGELASEEEVARFQREAAAAARMGKHPHIVAVHDLGAEAGVAYYAMELVRGQSLRALLAGKDIPPREAAELLEKVARAVHFAHGHGIIHRDLKPENVLVREDGEPQVMDFGLARDVASGAHLSITGQVMGTLAYMAPEQARGDVEATDARTDVYALGGILYDILTGVPPHPGRSPAVVLPAILRGDIVPPRRHRPGAPKDLETVCLKCLDLAPARRYPSAEALAEDLARFRRGEAVHARRVTWFERAWRRARRSPVTTTLVTGIAAAAIAAAALGWRAAENRRAAEEERTRLLRELDRSGRALVDAALACRAMGDAERSRAYAAELAEPVKALESRAPDLAEPHYHWGRMQRALRQMTEAERALDLAIAKASSAEASERSRRLLVPAQYERGVVRAEVYLRRLSDRTTELSLRRRQGTSDEDRLPGDPPVSEVEIEFPELSLLRGGACEDLAAALAATDRSGLQPGAVEFARALIEVLRGGLSDAARTHLEEALRQDPLLTEAYKVLAFLLDRQGRLEEAIECARKGCQRGQGFAAVWLQYQELLVKAADRKERTGEATEAVELWRESIQAGDRVVALDPDSLSGWSRRVDALCALAAKAVSTGPDGGRLAEQAEHAAERVMALAPGSLWAHYRRGQTRYLRALALRAGGADPIEAYRAAADDFRRAALAWPKGSVPFTALGKTLLVIAEELSRQGSDATTEMEEAAAALDRAIQINPGSVAAATELGVLHARRAESKSRRGEAPDDEYATAVRWLRRALDRSPSAVRPLDQIASVHEALGDLARQRGKDPIPDYRLSLDARSRLRELQPDVAQCAQNQGWILLKLGRTIEASDGDGSEYLNPALESYDRAIVLDPTHRKARYQRADLLHQIGKGQARRGADPLPSLREAEAEYARFLDRFPGDAHAVNNLGAVCLDIGLYLLAREKDPSEPIGEALRRFEEALGGHPEPVMVLSNRALAARTLGDWEARRGKDPGASYALAAAACQEALTRAPDDAAVLGRRAGIYERWAEWKEGRGEDASAERAEQRRCEERMRGKTGEK